MIFLFKEVILKFDVNFLGRISCPKPNTNPKHQQPTIHQSGSKRPKAQRLRQSYNGGYAPERFVLHLQKHPSHQWLVQHTKKKVCKRLLLAVYVIYIYTVYIYMSLTTEVPFFWIGFCWGVIYTVMNIEVYFIG